MDEILKEYCIHLDEVHKEAEEWDERINLLQILDCLKIRKDVYNIAEVLILFIDERISYFQLENFIRTNDRTRKELNNKLEMNQVALQTLVNQMKRDNLLPNKFFGLRTLRRLSMTITELISMEIPIANPYTSMFKQANKNSSMDRFSDEIDSSMNPGTNMSENIASDKNQFWQADEGHNSSFNLFMRFKFNACLSVYKLTIFLDIHLNRSMNDLMIVSHEGFPSSMNEQLVKKYKVKSDEIISSDKRSDKLKPNQSNDISNKNNSELVITAFKKLKSKPLAKSYESIALNYHLKIFIRQIENGMMLNLHTTDPILQFEIKTRLDDLKKIFMNIYSDAQYLNELMMTSKMII